MLTPDEAESEFWKAPQAIEYATTQLATMHVRKRSSGGLVEDIVGDAVKPVALVHKPDGTRDVLFVCCTRSHQKFVCVAIPHKDIGSGKATIRLREVGWWCAPSNADKHLNAMLGDARCDLRIINEAPHQGLQEDETFLLNDRVFGPNAELWRIDPQKYIEAERKGSLQGWQTWTNAAVDFPLVLFAISTGLVNLLKLALRQPGFGICIFAPTSSGKSILTRLVRSIIGDPDKLEDWNTSRAGLEGKLLRLSHTPITPDELRSGVDIQRDETITHLIGNERLRTLAAGYLSGQRVQVVIFTNKEFKAGDPRLNKPNQGDDARWINIAVPSGKRGVLIGADENADTGAIMKTFMSGARDHHGWAYFDFAERLLSQKDWRGLCADAMERAEGAIGGNGITALEERGRRIFALIGAAGSLSARLGTTTWDERAPLDAAAECFNLWRTPQHHLNRTASLASASNLDIVRALSVAGARSAGDKGIDEPTLMADKILSLLGAQHWEPLERWRLNSIEPDQNDADSPPFLFCKNDVRLVCASTAYITKQLGEHPAAGLRRLKDAGHLVTNASGGLCLSIKAGGRAQQFIAVRASSVELKVEEGLNQ